MLCVFCFPLQLSFFFFSYFLSSHPHTVFMLFRFLIFFHAPFSRVLFSPTRPRNPPPCLSCTAWAVCPVYLSCPFLLSLLFHYMEITFKKQNPFVTASPTEIRTDSAHFLPLPLPLLPKNNLSMHRLWSCLFTIFLLLLCSCSCPSAFCLPLSSLLFHRPGRQD